MDNRVKNAFGQLHADDALKTGTKAFIYEKTNGYRKKITPAPRRLAIVMACLLIAVLSWRGYSDFFTSVSTISVDVNPSFELDINRFDRVISVHAYNDGGTAVLSSANIRFLDYRKAMDVLLQDENLAGFLNDKQPVEVTVFGNSDQKNSEMLENLSACTASRGNIQCALGNSEDASKAHALGLSYGKYRAFLELQALDPSVTADDVKGLTMRQIRDMIRERSESEAAPADPAGKNGGSDGRSVDNSNCGSNGSKNGSSNGNDGKGNSTGKGNGSGNGNSNGHGYGGGKGHGNGAGNGSQGHGMGRGNGRN